MSNYGGAGAATGRRPGLVDDQSSQGRILPATGNMPGAVVEGMDQMMPGLQHGMALSRMLDQGGGLVTPGTMQGIADPSQSGGMGGPIAAAAAKRQALASSTGNFGSAKYDPGSFVMDASGSLGGRPATAGVNPNGSRGAGDFSMQAANAMSPPGSVKGNALEQRGVAPSGIRSDQDQAAAAKAGAVKSLMARSSNK